MKELLKYGKRYIYAQEQGEEGMIRVTKIVFEYLKLLKVVISLGLAHRNEELVFSIFFVHISGVGRWTGRWRGGEVTWVRSRSGVAGGGACWTVGDGVEKREVEGACVEGILGKCIGMHKLELSSEGGKIGAGGEGDGRS